MTVLLFYFFLVGCGVALLATFFRFRHPVLLGVGAFVALVAAVLVQAVFFGIDPSPPGSRTVTPQELASPGPSP